MTNEPKLVFEPLTKKDIAICEVVGGQNNGLVIYINQGHCCDKCSMMCKRTKKKCCNDCLSSIYGGCHSCENNQYSPHYQTPIKEFKIFNNSEMIPLPKDKPEHGYIFGKTGSGKSAFCVKYANKYQELFDNPVYLISNVNKDEEIDKIKDLIRIPIEDIKEDKITPESIHDSLIIFDDVDSISDKKISNMVEKLRDLLLTTGRHHNVYCLITSHLGANFNHTKVPINESAFVVIFPRGGNWVQLDRILKNYCGLDREEETKIKRLQSRWVMINKNYPSYVVYEKGCYLL